MRAFIILGFLVAAIKADNLGYAYGQGVSGSLLGSGSTLVGSAGYPTQTLIAPRYGSSLIGSGSRLINSGTGGGLISTGGYGGGLISTGGYGSGLISTGGYGSGVIRSGGGLISSGGLVGNGGLISTGGSGLVSTGSAYTGRNTRLIEVPSLDSIPQTVEYSKQFFDFSAPEEAQEDGIVTKQLSNVLKKNLQVVFIKAPENNAATNAALQLAKQAIEQRTAIYVLSKQNDGAQLIGQLQQIQESVPTSPEVRIIRYRTPEDLAIAKENIRSQYELTGGSSEHYDGGIAPVLNYASNVGSLSSSGVLVGSGTSGSSLVGSGISGGSLIGSGISGGSLVGSGISGGSLVGSGISSTVGGLSTLGGSNVGGYLPPFKKK